RIPEWLNQGLLFGSLSGANCWVYIVDGTDNPPVEVEFGDPMTVRSFSEFAFQLAWGRLTGASEYEEDVWGLWLADRDKSPDFPLLQAAEPAFGRRDITFLAARFAEGSHRIVSGDWRPVTNPRTGETRQVFAPTSVLRFFGSGVRVQVTCKGNPDKRS